MGGVVAQPADGVRRVERLAQRQRVQLGERAQVDQFLGRGGAGGGEGREGQ